jgi:hypothetical protein
VRVWKEPTGTFLIVRGSKKEQYFSFFVDHDSSCWSKNRFDGMKFPTIEEAERAVEELRHRAKLLRVHP